jgi:hypothetical protein
MGWLLHRLVVVIAVMILIASGVGRATSVASGKPACSDIQGTAQTSTHEGHEHHSHHGEVHSPDGHPAATMHGEQDSSVPPQADCLKCCGICTASSCLPDCHPVNSRQAVHAVAYVLPAPAFTTRAIAIDPGVPKQIG